jgi:phosphoribosyl-AMP cyclohydrolase
MTGSPVDAAALAATIQTGIAHYYSRSRRAPWRKGDTSGNVQSVHELRTDCDQDVIWISVDTAGEGVNCHTGHRSCFYRALPVGDRRDGTDRLVVRD